MNIDAVLSPYADEQPDVSMDVKDTIVERIPSIINPATGQVTQQFQQFFNNVVDAVTTNDIKQLYELSDKAVNFDVFQSEFDEFQTELSNIFAKPKSQYGIDVELNLNRFKSKHRNLIGGFYVIIYTIEKLWTLSNYKTELHQKADELFFTYKNNNFVLLSYRQGFEEYL